MFQSISLQKAQRYEKYRLPYAQELVAGLLQYTGSIEVIADMGAGTGQLSRLFADNCQKIYAVEPDASMREVATDTLKIYPNIDVMDGCAEDTTLPDNRVDLLLIGNAFHRFKKEAIEELHRILKPDAWIAVVYYVFTNQAFTDMLFGDLNKLESMSARSAKSWHRLPVEDLLNGEPVHTLRYPQAVTEDWDTFWGAACAGIEAPESDDDDFEAFREINKRVFDRFKVGDHIRIEYETHVTLSQHQ